MNRLRDCGTLAVSGSYNYLTSLFSSSLGTTDPLLSALYGGGQSAGSTGQTPVQALKAAETNETKQVKATAQQSQVQQAVKAFTQSGRDEGPADRQWHERPDWLHGAGDPGADLETE
jgi:hypothetical protein